MRRLLLALCLASAARAGVGGCRCAELALAALAEGDAGACRRGRGGTGRPRGARHRRMDTACVAAARNSTTTWTFSSAIPDWPGLPYLRAQGEPSLPRGGDPDRVMAYFGGQSPRTGLGALALANAHMARGNTQAARDVVTAAWTGLTMSGDAAAALRSGYQSLLNEGDLHIRRLDHLLWEGRRSAPAPCSRWCPNATTRWPRRDWACARVPGVDALIEAVPDSLADDPGLAFERFIWRIRSGFWDTAGELLAERSTSAEALGRPAAWADRRADLARDVMREGEFDTCYDYAANHFLCRDDDDIAFAELEWIAGYCAFRLGPVRNRARPFHRVPRHGLQPDLDGPRGLLAGPRARGLGQRGRGGGGLRAGRAIPVELLRTACAGTRRPSGRPGLPCRGGPSATGARRSSPHPRSSTPHFFYTKRANATSPSGSSRT
jgi:soluble lytic murein transglycosylase